MKFPLIVTALLVAVLITIYSRKDGDLTPQAFDRNQSQSLNAAAFEDLENTTTNEPVGARDFSSRQAVSYAYEVITNAGHSCSEVESAEGVWDGSLLATCSDGERYRVARLSPEGPELAMKCSAMEELGIEGGC